MIANKCKQTNYLDQIQVIKIDNLYHGVQVKCNVTRQQMCEKSKIETINRTHC